MKRDSGQKEASDAFADVVIAVCTGAAGWIRKRFAPIMAAVFVLLATYAALWFLMHRIQGEVVAFIRDSLQCELRTGKIKVTPGLRIVIEDARLVPNAGVLKLPDLTAESILLAADVPSMISGKVRLREVTINRPVLTLYQEPDGSYNLSRWLESATSCESSNPLEAVPNRVTIRDGRFIMEPPPGAAWRETLELATVNGVVGVTPEDSVGVDLQLLAFKSSVAMKGSFTPCVPAGMRFEGTSDVFDFTYLADTVTELFFRTSDQKPRLPGGSGRLSFTIEGAYSTPYISGKISTRDADASFSYADKTLNFTDVLAGAGTEKVTGSGSIDLSQEDLPYKFSFVLSNISLQRMFRDAVGYRYAPEGLLSGFLKISGSLKESRAEVTGGSVTATHVKLKVPPLPFASPGARRDSYTIIPIEKASARLATQRGQLALRNLRIEADAWAADGSATIGGRLPLRALTPDNNYSLHLKFEPNNAASIAALFHSLNGKLGGSVDAEINLHGAFGKDGITGGNGSIKIRNGFISNPYAGRNNYSYQVLDFDIAEVAFEFARHNLRIVSAIVNGNGFDVNSSGSIGYDGGLQLVARARLSPERAREYEGLALFLPEEKGSSLVTYEARCDVSGDVRRPQTTWHRPSVTRWNNYLW